MRGSQESGSASRRDEELLSYMNFTTLILSGGSPESFGRAAKIFIDLADKEFQAFYSSEKENTYPSLIDEYDIERQLTYIMVLDESGEIIGALRLISSHSTLGLDFHKYLTYQEENIAADAYSLGRMVINHEVLQTYPPNIVNAVFKEMILRARGKLKKDVKNLPIFSFYAIMIPPVVRFARRNGIIAEEIPSQLHGETNPLSTPADKQRIANLKRFFPRYWQDQTPRLYRLHFTD